MRLSPHSAAFALLLGALAALPSFGIDMSLPALNAMGASLGVSPDRAGLTISLFMVGFAIAPPLCGPLSDRIGRKPIMLVAVALFAIGSLGCAVANSLATLLPWRVVEGMGAGVGTAVSFAIIQDLFKGPAGRAKLSHLASVTLFVPMVAPAAGTAVLAAGNWRSISAVLAGIGLLLLVCVWRFLGESLTPSAADRLSPAVLLRGYARALSHPLCLGYILVNAAGFGAVFAYISGSSLYFIGSLGLSRGQYSLIYAATFLGIMAGVWINGRLSTRGVAAAYPLGVGLALALGSAVWFLAAILTGWVWVPGLVAILCVGTMGFGLVAPNAIHGAMQPLPAHAGAVSAMSGFVQVAAQSVSSAAVVTLNHGNPGLSIAVSMVFWCSLGLVVYLSLTRPAEQRAMQLAE